jgi:hypothetical protein
MDTDELEALHMQRLPRLEITCRQREPTGCGGARSGEYKDGCDEEGPHLTRKRGWQKLPDTARLADTIFTT